jgi:hypothetical protein
MKEVIIESPPSESGYIGDRGFISSCGFELTNLTKFVRPSSPGFDRVSPQCPPFLLGDPSHRLYD